MRNMPHMSIHECRQVRANAAQRKRIVRGVLAVVAFVLVCLLTMVLWQLWPRTAFGQTMQPRAMLVVMNEKVVLSNCTSEEATCSH